MLVKSVPLNDGLASDPHPGPHPDGSEPKKRNAFTETSKSEEGNMGPQSDLAVLAVPKPDKARFCAAAASDTSVLT